MFCSFKPCLSERPFGYIFFTETKFTWHKINHFKVNNSVAFSIATMFYNHLHYLGQKHFYHPKRKSLTLSSLSSFCPSLSPWQPPIYILSLWIYLFWISHINRTIHYMTFSAWLFSLSTMFLRLIPIIASIGILFLFYYCFIHLWVHCILFILLLGDSYCCFHCLALTNDATVNIYV